MANDQKSAQDRYSNNNVAITTTWLFMFRREELDRNFEDSRDFPVKKFAFFNNAQSSEGRNVDAEHLAASLDQFLRKKGAAVYETGWTRSKSVQDLTDILKDGEKLFCELAAKTDDIFRFPSEA
jgi:hypothetical protein